MQYSINAFAYFTDHFSLAFMFYLEPWEYKVGRSQLGAEQGVAEFQKNSNQ